VIDVPAIYKTLASPSQRVAYAECPCPRMPARLSAALGDVAATGMFVQHSAQCLDQAWTHALQLVVMKL
jgi:hypothetical protein